LPKADGFDDQPVDIVFACAGKESHDKAGSDDGDRPESEDQDRHIRETHRVVILGPGAHARRLTLSDARKLQTDPMLEER
jgi:hypothetical protein